MQQHTEGAKGPLDGLRVLDLSRILAGPTATQLLGDLGAEVIKVERPGYGDDTRKWGPPFLTNAQGEDSSESAYYLCANRNKKSIAIDFTQPEGQKLVRELAALSDILIENHQVGALARYGLDYASLAEACPRLIYCSITGFGQTGPYAHRPGYDFMVQGMGGIMSLTGRPDEQGGEPTKVGVGIADVMCGMYASNGVLAALHARQHTGKGQYIDLSLFDAQIAWLINQGAGYLVSGEVPPRRGNDHPTIVPYGAFEGADEHFIIAVGNDQQYQRLCDVLADKSLATDERFMKNADRVRHRDALNAAINALTREHTAAHWLTALEANNIPCGPINDLEAAFNNPQAQHRNMTIRMPHPLAPSGEVSLIGNPLNLSETPVSYRSPPPTLGQHTEEILTEVLQLSDADIESLFQQSIIA